MIPLLLGVGLVLALFLGAGSFAQASIGSAKAFLGWVAALAGLSLLALLVLSGRGMLALSGLVLVVPLAWSSWQERRGRTVRAAPRVGRQEALEILGLDEGASDSDVQAAYVRLMRVAHPDTGGSDWLASRVNQARDVLLRR